MRKANELCCAADLNVVHFLNTVRVSVFLVYVFMGKLFLSEEVT